MLELEAPLEYSLIFDVLGKNEVPDADFIEEIGYASINPLFKKPKFRRALIEYRQYGVYKKKRMVDKESIAEYHKRVYNSQIHNMKYTD